MQRNSQSNTSDAPNDESSVSHAGVLYHNLFVSAVVFERRTLILCVRLHTGCSAIFFPAPTRTNVERVSSQVNCAHERLGSACLESQTTPNSHVGIVELGASDCVALEKGPALCWP